MIGNIINLTENKSGRCRGTTTTQSLQGGANCYHCIKNDEKELTPQWKSSGIDSGKPPSSINHFLKYSCNKSSKRVHFEDRFNWEEENEKAERRLKECERAKKDEKKRNQRRPLQDETFLLLMLSDIDILVKENSHSDEVSQLLEDIFKHYRIYPSPADQRSELYPRLTLLRAKARSDTKYLLSFEGQIQNWSRKSGAALLTLPTSASTFSTSQKLRTQRGVFYHLKHTIRINDLLIDYRSEEQELFRRCLQWFFRELRKSLERCRCDIKNPHFTEIELESGFSMLQGTPTITFDDMNETTKNILFLMGGLSAFLHLFD